MKLMSTTAQRTAEAGSGYKCSKCGQRFYNTRKKIGRWTVTTEYAYDKCWLHCNTSRCASRKAKPKWCF